MTVFDRKTSFSVDLNICHGPVGLCDAVVDQNFDFADPLLYSSKAMPQSPTNPAAIAFWLTWCAAPVALDDSVAVPLAVLEAVFVAAVPVTEAPVEASVVVPEAELELAVAVALPTLERRSRPAVIVTVTRLSEMSLMTADVTPGSFALGPAIVSMQLAVWEASWQSRSAVLGCGVSQTICLSEWNDFNHNTHTSPVSV